ncbi:MAG: hypothetical protein DRN06_02130 [Thermoprotei archaeon]|nr:MAG: hypothetical protein DRN06_02130 [Thermoprotei archaeon]
MEWHEDTTLFSATIRLSGRSLVLTIPKPLARRFMLKDGQKVTVVGMWKETPLFEGMIGIYLGRFKVAIPADGFELLVENPPKSLFIEGSENLKLQELQDLVTKYKCYVTHRVDEQELRIRGIFNGLNQPSMITPAGKDVERIAKDLMNKLSKKGLKVVGMKTFKVELERSMDPGLIARRGFKDIDGIKAEWVL